MHRKIAIQALFVLFAVLLTGAVASASSQAAPVNTSPPTVSGTPKVGQTLTTSNGTWSNSPTSFTYQWQRCSSSSSCTNITGATSKSYTLTAANAGFTIRSAVTASNADGKTTAYSSQTATVTSSGAPTNTTPPIILGDAELGQDLSVDEGIWTGNPTFTYQWQRCSALGTGCAGIAGATTDRYTVTTADLGFTLRVRLTAHNAQGSTTVFTDVTAVVTAPPKAGNHAPTIRFISLKRRGIRVYAKFEVCDDTAKAVTVFERDTKRGVLSYGRKFSVTPTLCTIASRHWTPAARFRTAGRFTVKLQAVDKSHAGSKIVQRSLIKR
jgi:hypothetical protein